MTAPTDTIEATEPAEAASEVADEMRVRFPCLAIEGFETRDGRLIEVGEITSGMLPMSVHAQLKSPHGGDGPPAATVVGRLDTLVRQPGSEVVSQRTGQPFPDSTFVWSGEGVISTDVDVDGINVADFVRRRYLRGTSADLLPREFTLFGEEGFAPDPDNPSRRVVVHSGEIGGVTLVPIAAFGECFVELAEEQAVPDLITAEELPAGLMASAVPTWRSAELGDVVVAAVPAAKRERAQEEGDTYPGTNKFPIATREMARNAIRLHGGSDIPAEKVKAWLIRRLKAKGWEDLIPDDWRGGAHSAVNEETLTASALACRPPLSCFTDPGFTEETPLTIEDEHPGGYRRVYGHIAVDSRPHIGYGGKPIYAPASRCDYAFFNTGAVRCLDEDGNTRIAAVGHLTMDTGHADINLSYLGAARHYDHTGFAWADVAAGKDRFGTWVNGVTKPGLTEGEIAFAYAHPPSGDWRPIDGHLELVAALCVNTAGIPVPRARIASGEVMALVAAGALPPRVLASPGTVPLDYDALADAFVARLDQREEQRRQDGELSAEYASLVAELDDTTDVVAALLAEVDDTPERVAVLLAELDLDEGDFTFANWVEKAGGLPLYIKRISKHLRKRGMSESHAIATAVNAAKKMCTTGDLNFPGSQQVNPGSRAEACAAVASWEEKKARAKTS